VDTSNDVYPKTGTCVDLSSGATDSSGACKYPSTCHTDSDNWGICPYCKTYKTEDSHGLLSLGTYVSGSGSVSSSDPMIYTNGDDSNCNGIARSSKAYWYCWYSAFPTSADVLVTKLDMLWYESGACEYMGYIYTPLACDWAT